MTYVLGIRENLRPFLEQLLQVFFVGLTIGLQRTVIPALAETEFGIVQKVGEMPSSVQVVANARQEPSLINAAATTDVRFVSNLKWRSWFVSFSCAAERAPSP